MMEPDIQNQFETIERQRAELQRVALALNDVQLTWIPSKDTWSIQQIIEHLVLSDETIGRACDTPELEAPMFRILPSVLRRAMILNALNRDVILPMPSPAAEPDGEIALSELLSRWETMRGEMRRELNTQQGDEKRYSHPVLGPLTSRQMLELGKTHTAYHTRQIAKLQRNAGFPRQTEVQE